MQTPIWDFLTEYAAREPARFHMPGHKGRGPLGFEQYDITEVSGADELFVGEGIIGESEANASRLFGVPTFYSTAGSTLCIQAMLCLTVLWWKERGPAAREKLQAGAKAQAEDDRPVILAARNAHKALVNASALLDLRIDWLRPTGDGPYYSHVTQAVDVEQALAEYQAGRSLPAAVYLTSPDYLGQVTDLRAIADVCHRYGVLLLVDNAHGAYLKFLPDTMPAMHPMDLGVDLCCDSAHKTLPVLTGGAYLHIGREMGEEQQRFFTARAKDAMALFGSSSPSYLILASLDACNAYLEQLPAELTVFLEQIADVRRRLKALGVELVEEEPLKLTLCAASVGCSGQELAAHLEAAGIHPEFCDPDYVVLMLSTHNTAEDFDRLLDVLTQKQNTEQNTDNRSKNTAVPLITLPEKVCSPREAVLAPKETLPIEQCLGRICAAAAISCPPAVPIVVCGERIDENVQACFAYYGITHCTVMKEV